MSKSIEVIIQPDGSLKIDAVGFSVFTIRVLVAFESCLDFTSPILLNIYHESAPSDWFQRAGARAA